MSIQISELELLDAPSNWGDIIWNIGAGLVAGGTVVSIVLP